MVYLIVRYLVYLKCHQGGLIQLTLEDMIVVGVHHPIAVWRNGTGQDFDIQGYQESCFVDYVSLEFGLYIRAWKFCTIPKFRKGLCLYNAIPMLMAQAFPNDGWRQT